MLYLQKLLQTLFTVYTTKQMSWCSTFLLDALYAFLFSEYAEILTILDVLPEVIDVT